MENIRTVSTHALSLTISIVLIALNLRPAMAAVGPLLSTIRGDIDLSFGMASLLTMLPVMTMGLAMFFGMRIARRMGEHRTIALSLLVIGVSTSLRVYLDSSTGLILSAVSAGLGIAMIQSLMPALIKRRFGSNVSLFMGLYVTAIMGGAAIAASLSPLIMVSTASWQIGLGSWGALALVALVFWLGQRSSVADSADVPTCPDEAFIGKPRAWTLGIFFGLGTASYTCVLAWLAPYYVEKGWSEQGAGLMLSFMTAMEVLSGLATPALANRSRDKRRVLAVLLLLIIIGFCGLATSPDGFSLIWPCLLGLGIGGLFPMSLIVTMDHLDNPQRAGGLTAFAQGVGYLIAGLSPLLAGIIRDRLGSFEWAWWCLAVVMMAMLLMVPRFNPTYYAKYFSMR
ncbi:MULTISPECIES: cyanate transporter [unclassified Pseudomonas]|uniref:cyanate transporter n=1 Tax=unclassified Pseudomonas TaxID=196821 RepID=UPI002B23C4D2|nr:MULTISPECIES: cyanate transporter [unclassified Pseudomonas]MEA9979784.1 cyanate transporter [Pseudomonas sp. RTS4]MEB0199993.1 cyanate transporter [Pseudomonas sp. 5S4]MEB0248431.1 cyanate transporter [Pseudomonas sp. 10S5]